MTGTRGKTDAANLLGDFLRARRELVSPESLGLTQIWRCPVRSAARSSASIATTSGMTTPVLAG